MTEYSRTDDSSQLPVLAETLDRSGPSTRPTSLRRRLASGFFWVLVSAVFTQSSGFLDAIIPARILGIEAYGKLAAVQSTLTLLASLAGLGIGTTATRYVSQLRQTEPARVGRILGLCTIITVLTASMFTCVLLFFAQFIASAVFGSSQLADELRLGAILLFFFTIDSYQVGALSGFEAFSRLARASFLQSIGSVAMMLVFTLILGLNGSILALGGGALLSWLIQGHALRGEYRRWHIRINYSDVMKEKRIFGEFALPAALSGILGGIVTAGGNALLIRQINGLVEVAIFNAANTIRTIALFAPSLLTRVTLPMLSNLHGIKDRISYQKTFGLSLLLSGGFTVVFSVGLFLFTPILLSLFGKAFVGGRLVVAIVLASAVLEVLGNMFFQVLYSHGRVWIHLAIASIWSVIVLGGTFLFAPMWGANSLATSYGVAWFISTGLYAVVAKVLLDRDRRNLSVVEDVV